MNGNKKIVLCLAAAGILFLLVAVRGHAEDVDPATTMQQMDAVPAAGKKDFISLLQSFLAKPKGPQDIDPALFKDFWLRWEMVTTRYKPDGNELRFIYVNKTGAEALASGTYPFPEGTVFAKIAAQGVHDPIFDNSLVPGPINRVQIMLKKANDPNARDGWVYSVYIPDSKIMGHISHAQIDACQACHVVAKARDMVFAQPFPTPSGASPSRDKADLVPDDSSFKDSFHKIGIGVLSSAAKQVVTIAAPDEKFVKHRTMPAFSGTLFESREVLAGFAREDKMVYVLDSANGAYMLVAVPHKNDSCVHMISINKNMTVTLTPKTAEGAPPAKGETLNGPPIGWDMCYDDKKSSAK